MTMTAIVAAPAMSPAPAASLLAQAMQRMDAQSSLFAAQPSRLEILAASLPVPSSAPMRVNVWRNHAVETLFSLARPYLDFGALALDFHLSAYDDSLSFLGRSAADLELICLDSSRISEGAEFVAWLLQRVAALRAMSSAPILLLSWLPEGWSARKAELQAELDALPGVYFADLAAVCEAAQVKLLDLRLAKVAGTPLSAAAHGYLARELACRWLPALLLPPVKAVAVDLDHTLYSGVLGEDGPQGLTLTPAHARWQASLKALRQRGIFIALVSRNERADVEALLAQRSDFPLQREDFSVLEVSWGDKSQALQRIAQALNIDVSAMAFVDDNPGELAQVSQQLPNVRCVLAHADASLTERVLAYLPGLWRWHLSAEDALRVTDQLANAQRQQLAAAAEDAQAYFLSLQVRLSFDFHPGSRLARLVELSGKTNQFNLALRRYGEAELAALLKRDDHAVVSVQLRDRFSDSGSIAMLVARREGERLYVEELCISCRALGRRLEDSIVLLALRGMPLFDGCSELYFRVEQGPRNQPGREWLARWLAQLADEPQMPQSGWHAVDIQSVQRYAPLHGIQFENNS